MPKQRCEILRARDGTTSVEYAIMAAVIAAILLSAVANLGTGVSSLYTAAGLIVGSG